MIDLVYVKTLDDLAKNIFLPNEMDQYEVDIYSLEEALDKFTRYFNACKETFFVRYEEKAFAIGGLRETEAMEAVPWFLTSEIPNDARYSFIRLAMEKCKQYKEQYQVLYNYTAIENHTSHRFLEFLGFKIDRDHPCYFGNKAMVRFEWRRANGSSGMDTAV